MRRLFGLLLLLPLLAGCFAPGPSDVEWYEEVEDAFRVPLPVPTDGSGGWALVNRRLGVIGQGRVVARVDPSGEVLWRTRLPARFALTGRPGQVHAVVSPSEMPLTLIGAPVPGRLPFVATLDPLTGRFTELAYPPARTPGELRYVTVALASQTQTRTAVAATCLPESSCTLTAWDAATGQIRWKRRTRGPAVFAGPCDQGGMQGGRPDHLWRRCDPLVSVADGRLVTLLNGEDRLRSSPLDLPGGDIAQVLPTRYRIVVVTAPHGPGCRAQAAAYGFEADTGAPAWQRAFTWDQPRAAVREGCRRDPSIPLLTDSCLILPDAAGALVGDDYHGTFFLRLKPGEYPVIDGSEVLAYRVDGSHRDPLRTASTLPRSRPVELGPTAEALGQNLWYVPEKGRRGEVIAADVDGKITWRRTTGGFPFFLGNRLVYALGSELVALRTAD
ncbi:PQQ-binding-like beta-propeller repeat protein [Streptomyces sp. NBC_00236]|uniref:PQQ-binding-like beta-propeller repeat protein n=1 Tax=Streptomyces sp. NBC_00236 TaxID=2903639 RepID=UPI002E2B70BE|nr:PQQ-binding-like beta-propeller repeat protein [Streptomyces sp. NBC_00236]